MGDVSQASPAVVSSVVSKIIPLKVPEDQIRMHLNQGQTEQTVTERKEEVLSDPFLEQINWLYMKKFHNVKLYIRKRDERSSSAEPKILKCLNENKQIIPTLGLKGVSDIRPEEQSKNEYFKRSNKEVVMLLQN